MRKLTIIFIAATICSILNCITFLVEGNIPAFAGWFVSSCALVLLHMLFSGWQKLKAGYEAEIAKYKRDLDESWEREKIACKAVAEKREEITRLTEWNDPDEELPEYYKVVEIKYRISGLSRISIAWISAGDAGGYLWTIDGTDVLVNAKHVIGWRPIHE